MPIRHRIDRRLHQVETPVGNPAVESEIMFRDPWGEVDQRFDPRELGMPADLQSAIAMAFRAHDAPLAPRTRRGRWEALKIFGRFLREDASVKCCRDLDACAIRRFVSWLTRPGEGRGHKQASKEGLLKRVRQLLQHIARNDPYLFGGDLAIPFNAFQDTNEHREPALRLAPSDLRAILASC